MNRIDLRIFPFKYTNAKVDTKVYLQPQQLYGKTDEIPEIHMAWNLTHVVLASFF